jgi:hypothetical protein
MCRADGVRYERRSTKQKGSHGNGSRSQSSSDPAGPKAKTNRTFFLNQNLRGCSNETRLEMLWSEVRNRQAMAMTLQELWRDGNETLLRKGCMLITNGLAKVAGESLQHVGVGIALDTTGVAAWKAAGQVVHDGYASARVIGTRLLLKDDKGGDLGVHLISAHAPDSGEKLEVWEAWLDELEDYIGRKMAGDMLVIGMDANAALGVRKASDSDNWCTGWHGLHRVNPVGLRLQSFLMRLRLVAATTCMQKKRYGT